MNKFIIITPTRNEEAYIEMTLQSVITQAVLPQKWIIVNDGSEDGTVDMIMRYMKRYPFINLVNLPNRGYDLPGEGIIKAFYEGLKSVNVSDYDYLVKLDSDVSFDKYYFKNIFNEFSHNPRLGMASGQTYFSDGKNVVWEDTPLDHVRGASKIYRKACFQEIGGLMQTLGWDTVDEVTARMKGWQTQSFPTLKILHHRMMGSKDGIIKGNIRHGHISYVLGALPIYVFLRAVYRMFYPPFLIGGLAILWGFIKGYIQGEDRAVSKEFIIYYRKEQMKKILKFELVRRWLLKLFVNKQMPNE